jgi:hypothetical protein
MIVTEGQFRFLKRGQHQTIVLPVRRRDDGTAALISPPAIGAAYQAQVALFERGMTVTVVKVERAGETWRVRIAPGDRTDAVRYMARGAGEKDFPGYTTNKSCALDQDAPVVPPDFQRRITKTANDGWIAVHPAMREPKDKDLAARVEEALREQLVDNYTRWTPEEIAAHSHTQGDPKTIRKRRRALGLRALDGLPKLTEAEEDTLLRTLVLAGATEREIARRLDVSRDKARRLVQVTEWEEQRAA